MPLYVVYLLLVSAAKSSENHIRSLGGRVWIKQFYIKHNQTVLYTESVPWEHGYRIEPLNNLQK